MTFQRLLVSACLASRTGRAADRPVVVDVTRERVFSNPEILAMGGAGSAFASGAPGLVLSPAAPANRRHGVDSPVHWSLVLLQSRIVDHWDLSSLPEDGWARSFDLGLAGGVGGGAGGLLAAGQTDRLGNTQVVVVEGHAAAAATFLGGGLLVGLGPRLLSMRVTTDGTHRDFLGTGVEAGAILVERGWSFALTLRSGVTAGPMSSSLAGIGAAELAPGLVAGAGWSNAESLPEASGIPVRLVADIAVDGRVQDAQALGALLQENAVPRGQVPTVSPRIGGEVDVWRDRLRLRAGSYLEPSRTGLSGPRPHATSGLELRLFRVKALRERLKLDLAWQIGADYAPRYFRGAWLGLNLWQSGQVGQVVAEAPSNGEVDP